jgi:trk system potassium uptake protein TrkA
MKIAIAGGKAETDFLIDSLLRKNHKLVVINEDLEYCEYLAQTHGIPIVRGDPKKEYVLRDARIDGFDVIIALLREDYDNLAVCQMARQLHGVKKAVCIVSNPKNVNVFKRLGVNTAISATCLVSNVIEQASTIANLIKALPLEDEKVSIVEILVDEGYSCIGRKVSELQFPPNAIIGCVVRNTNMFVPNGQSILLKDDKLYIVSSPQAQEKAITAIRGNDGQL